MKTIYNRMKEIEGNHRLAKYAFAHERVAYAADLRALVLALPQVGTRKALASSMLMTESAFSKFVNGRQDITCDQANYLKMALPEALQAVEELGFQVPYSVKVWFKEKSL